MTYHHYDLDYILGHLHRIEYSYIAATRTIERITGCKNLPRDVFVEATETICKTPIADQMEQLVNELANIKENHNGRSAV